MTMKTFIKILSAAAVAALAVVSCDKQESILDNGTKTVNFRASELATKTVFGTPDAGSYPTLWTAGKVKVSLNYAKPVRAAITPSADGTTADFSASITQTGAAPYTFYSVSPASAAIGTYDKYKDWTIEFPAQQTPTSASVDERAQLLAGNTAALTAFPTEPITIAYKHLSAYGKMTLANLNLGGATINSIDLEAASDWAGTYYYYPEQNKLSAKAGTKLINIITSSTNDIWFACAPVDLGGTQLKVKVNTDSGVFEKSFTIPTGKKFEAGKVAKFSLDMTGAVQSPNTIYTLVTSLDELTVGSEVIVVSNSKDLALGEQLNYNRAAVGIIKNENTIMDPASLVGVFTLERGSKSMTAAFRELSGYLTSGSDDRYDNLMTVGTIDDNSSWSVTINGADFLIQSQGNNANNCIRYNNARNYFGASASASILPEEKVAIYKKNGSGTTEKVFVVLPTITVDTTPISIPAEGAAAPQTLAMTLADATGHAISAHETKDATAPQAAWIAGLNYNEAASELSFTVLPNTEPAPRTAYIIISATNTNGTVTKEIQVAQPGNVEVPVQTYSWILASGDLGKAAGSVSKGSPTLTWDATAATYVGFDSQYGRGFQIGSGNKPTTSYSLTTSALSGKLIRKITVNSCTAKGGTAKLSVSVGGVEKLTKQSLTTTATDYVIDNINASGDIKISWSNTVKKAFYIKSINIEYQ